MTAAELLDEMRDAARALRDMERSLLNAQKNTEADGCAHHAYRVSVHREAAKTWAERLEYIIAKAEIAGIGKL